MSKTVSTNSTTLLPVSDFLQRVDARVVGDLVADDGNRVAAGSLSTNDNLLACLKDATGEVESACLAGKRYSASDLASLTGVSQAKLYRLITRLALLMLFERRPDREMKMPEIAKQALDDLEMLAQGVRIFSFLEVQEAGLPQERVETPEDVEARNGTTYIAGRLLGRRSNRLLPGP